MWLIWEITIWGDVAHLSHHYWVTWLIWSITIGRRGLFEPSLSGAEIVFPSSLYATDGPEQCKHHESFDLAFESNLSRCPLPIHCKRTPAVRLAFGIWGHSLPMPSSNSLQEDTGRTPCIWHLRAFSPVALFQFIARGHRPYALHLAFEGILSRCPLPIHCKRTRPYALLFPVSCSDDESAKGSISVWNRAYLSLLPDCARCTTDLNYSDDESSEKSINVWDRAYHSFLPDCARCTTD